MSALNRVIYSVLLHRPCLILPLCGIGARPVGFLVLGASRLRAGGFRGTCGAGGPVGRLLCFVVFSPEVESYKWDSVQHINVLELIAFFNFLRFAARDLGWVETMFFHVVDSRVTSCVLAKGRSSSKNLNRLLRRICALLVACDLYLYPLWTISQWNFVDLLSRVWGLPPDG